MGPAHRWKSPTTAQVFFKQENVEVPKSWSYSHEVVVSKYFSANSIPPTRNLRAPGSYPASRARLRIGASRTVISQGGRRNLLRRADLAVREPIRRVQFAGVVQRRTVSRNTASAKIPSKGNWFFNRKTKEAERAKDRNTNIRRAVHASSSPSKDDMESIMHLAYSEAMLFKYGSGTGTDLTTDPFEP